MSIFYSLKCKTLDLYNFLCNLYSIRKIDVVSIQMGKVGSTSILKSINHCYQGHSWDSDLPNKYFSSRDGSTTLGYCLSKLRWALKIALAKRAVRSAQNDNKKIKMVVGVREPIGRNISGYFQSLNRRELDESPKSHICKYFCYVPHMAPLYWFDNEFLRHFNIDIFSHPFDREKGFTIFSSGGFDVFVYKIESLSTLEPELGEFLGIEEFKLKVANRQEDKWSRELYKSVLNQISFSEEYCGLMYNSKYARHFYTDVEIGQFTKRWCC